MNPLRPSNALLFKEAAQIIQQHAVATSITDEQLTARRMSLATFTKRFWPIVEPSTPLIWNWHLSAICDHVQALLEGKLDKNRLLICVPPGSMKSTIVSVMAPAWKWINHPSWRSIFASGNASVSTRDSMKCRAILESGLYRRVFGIGWDFASDMNLKTSFANTQTGTRTATSAGAKVTGSRSDALFIDDPLDASDSYSTAARVAVITWYTQSFANRLNDLRSGTLVMIMQRLHSEDLAGYVLEHEPNLWETLIIPQEFEPTRRTISSLGWTDPRLEDGALMFPERFPASIIESEKLRLGSSGYAGQHLQRPSAAEGEVFHHGHLKFWPKDQPLPAFRRIVQSWDCAFKTGAENDYSVLFEIGEFEDGLFLLNCHRARMAYPQLKAMAVSWAELTKPTAVLVEDAASGQSLVQELKQNSRLPIVPVRVLGDKLTRAHACVPTWEAGRIHVRADAPWLPAFLDELHAFPKAPHDDQVDSFVQGVRYLTSYIGGANLIAHYRSQLQAVEGAKKNPKLLSPRRADSGRDVTGATSTFELAAANAYRRATQ